MNSASHFSRVCVCVRLFFYDYYYYFAFFTSLYIYFYLFILYLNECPTLKWFFLWFMFFFLNIFTKCVNDRRNIIIIIFMGPTAKSMLFNTYLKKMCEIEGRENRFENWKKRRNIIKTLKGALKKDSPFQLWPTLVAVSLSEIISGFWAVRNVYSNILYNNSQTNERTNGSTNL